MAKIEVKTLFGRCAEECAGFDTTLKDGAWQCSKQWLCRYGATAMLKELQERFEEQEHEAWKSPNGLKEPATWNKAIRILEEYME